MEISNARHQAMAGHGLEEIVGCPKIQLQQQQQQQEKKQIRPHPEQPLKCPRCASSNTKFCYYNNYSLSQPRYFCKGCRRYWTQGGSLRNVPVGGGCRKNKRPSSTSASNASSTSSSKRAAQDQDLTMSCTAAPPLLPTLSLPPLPYDPSDLTLAFAGSGQLPMKQFGGLEDDSNNLNLLLGSSSIPAALAPPPSQTGGGFLDILRSGFMDMASSAAPAGFDAIYYGGVNGEEEGFGGATTTATSTSCDKDNNGGDNKMQMGVNFPWQDIAAAGSLLDSGRDCNNWNINSGVNGWAWQGLVNSSLL